MSEELGRLWEALGWSSYALRHDPSLAWAIENVTRLHSMLTPKTPMTLAAANPVRELDPKAFPLTRHSGKTWDAAQPVESSETGVRFENVAAAIGIEFRYFNGNDPKTMGNKMYEVNGGGVGVLDYDRDGWPDLYLTQGCKWPPPGQTNSTLDAIYRNNGGVSFEEVSRQANIREPGFGQGVTVGDFDNDGFPDLYVANIGKNRLFRNQGDGSFVDVTDAAGLNGQQWTTSCAMADLNGDSFPDLYDVNYLQGKDLFERTCVHEDGIVRVCMPKEFDAEQDRLYLSRGGGPFLEQSRATGIDVADAPGLGIVVADLDGSGLPAIFVANDGVRNFYFRNVDTSGTVPQFHEQGILHGVAFDVTGQSQACMGIAVGEVSGDARLDLLVTNFLNELNCLYVQESNGQFRDATRKSGLDRASYQVTGFGTEFLDADLDGRPDLVIANGHVADRTALDEPYEMKPQFYQNIGGGRFQKTTAEKLGKYFEKKHLGRALAVLDWNRDGREDFAVMHLDEPVALVSNQSDPAGSYLSLRLVGVRSNRDAIGTEVTVLTGGRRIHRQLTAGSGFQASNQRVLTFGLGQAKVVDRLEIRWPSGQQQSWSQVPTNTELIAIEGTSQLAALP
ncbi:MAG TPA: CRTAC1 family protein [Pirellulaceae bacterium]|nr:CRTAC1 family protein [Pirellulaceae bacterium]